LSDITTLKARKRARKIAENQHVNRNEMDLFNGQSRTDGLRDQLELEIPRSTILCDASNPLG